MWSGIFASAAFNHTYTHEPGALPAGNDVIAPLNLTLAQAEAKCSSLAACIGITFKAPTAVWTNSLTEFSLGLFWEIFIAEIAPSGGHGSPAF